MSKEYYSNCPESAIYTHDEGSRRDGTCIWCGRKFKSKVERPAPTIGAVAEIDAAYRYTYDPDWGTDRRDV